MKEKEVQPRAQNTYLSINTNTSIMSEQGAYDGSDLIVEFNEQRQPSETCGKVPATMKRQVLFFEDVVVHCFQYPSRDEVSKRWYSKNDKSIFRKELKDDIQSIRLLLSFTPLEAVEKEVLYECIGLEPHLTKQVSRLLKEKRRRHIHSIVEMQDYLSEENLSAYAIRHSSEMRERAQKLASGYLKISS